MTLEGGRRARSAHANVQTTTRTELGAVALMADRNLA
jgi:hypothetical protein